MAWTLSHEYFPDGKIFRTTEIELDNSKCVWEYNIEGDLVKKTFCKFYGQEFVTDFVRDSNHNVIKRTLSRPDGQQEVTEFVRDANGAAIKRIFTNLEGKKFVTDIQPS